MKSILTKKQVKSFDKMLPDNRRIVARVRYDDECGNGHNSFSITADIYSSQTSTSDRYFESGGYLHEEIAKHFPDLAPFIKWHLTNSDGPMHYIPNTMYHASPKEWDGSDKEPNINAARNSAVWPDATLEQLQDKNALEARLPSLMEEFAKDVQSLGFVY